MIKKTLLMIVFGVGAITIAVGVFRFVWPIIDAEGTITNGGYRGIQIGDAKPDVELRLKIPGPEKLKLFGYVDSEGRTTSIPSRDGRDAFDESNTWLLNYPGIHKESIVLVFENQRVVRIEYYRDMLSP